MQKQKEELLQIIADCSQNVPEGYERYSYSDLTSKNIYLSEDSFCSEEEEFIENDDYTVEVESIRGSEGDGAEMFLTFKITDKETNTVGYLEYSGRYSSWDSSSYDDSYVVLPEEVTVIQYNRIK